MKQDHMVYLPLDERPCNYLYPQYIAGIGGQTLEVPPIGMLGKKKQPADTERLWQWLQEKAEGASRLIISLDMLVYGGIVPSRLHELEASTCIERLNRLQTLKKAHPQLRIDAFELITRAPARNGSGEEPDYYEDYGYDIFRYGVITDRENMGIADSGEQEEKREIIRRVPESALQDFIGRRRKNFQTNRRAIELAADGVIDYLIIPLDDCREYGFAPAERRELARILAEKSLLSRVPMYPGADEIGCTLTARAVACRCHIHPSIWMEYSSQTGRLTVPSYEDRSIGETAPFHVLAAGGTPAGEIAEADLALLIHPPTKFSLRQEKEPANSGILLETERNLPMFMERIRALRSRDLPCFIGDCAIPNRADRTLMQFLFEQGLLDEIEGYSGWNTSSNALGTVAAQAVAYVCAAKSGLRTAGTQSLSREFRFLRYLEDWGYMAEVRPALAKELSHFGRDLTPLDLRGKSGDIEPEIARRLEKFRANYLPRFHYSFTVSIPWDRLFEIELQIRKKGRQP